MCLRRAVATRSCGGAVVRCHNTGTCASGESVRQAVTTCTRVGIQSSVSRRSYRRTQPSKCSVTQSADKQAQELEHRTLPAPSVAVTGGSDAAANQYLWAGSDTFTPLGDRRALPPLPLPTLSEPRRVTLVRHGQSTWNAEGRVQGCTDFSVLSVKGVQQAHATSAMLAAVHFHELWYSPLARAAATAEVVWGHRPGAQHEDPLLREVDLYSFQGLLKSEVKSVHEDAYRAWHTDPERFELDGHYPLRELWYRASLAWHKVLGCPSLQQYVSAAGGNIVDNGNHPSSSNNNATGSSHHALVVAHNAINQAMVSVALQLPPSFFRRMVQSNAAVTCLTFSPGSSTQVLVECVNASPRVGLAASRAKAPGGLVGLLVAPDSHQLAASTACVSVLSKHPVRHIVMLSQHGSGRHSSQEPAMQWASELAEGAGAAAVAQGHSEPDIYTAMCEDVQQAWQVLVSAADDEGGCTVVAIVDAQTASALVCTALGIPAGTYASQFMHSPGGLTVLELTGTDPSHAVVRCINSRGHIAQ